MSYEDRLAELGIELPDPPAAVAAYVPTVLSGSTLYVSGQVPFRDGGLGKLGKVGAEVTQEEAIEEARICAVNALAQIRAALGSLNRVQRILKLGVFVASDPTFSAQPLVANGASELFVEVFGEAGRHARSAVGVAVLPLDVPVEVDVILEVAT